MTGTQNAGETSPAQPVENLKDWLDAALRHLNAKPALHPIDSPWLDRPLVRELVVPTPEIAAQLGRIAGSHPGALRAIRYGPMAQNIATEAVGQARKGNPYPEKLEDWIAEAEAAICKNPLLAVQRPAPSGSPLPPN